MQQRRRTAGLRRLVHRHSARGVQRQLQRKLRGQQHGRMWRKLLHRLQGHLQRHLPRLGKVDRLPGLRQQLLGQLRGFVHFVHVLYLRQWMRQRVCAELRYDMPHQLRHHLPEHLRHDVPGQLRHVVLGQLPTILSIYLFGHLYARLPVRFKEVIWTG